MISYIIFGLVLVLLLAIWIRYELNDALVLIDKNNKVIEHLNIHGKM